MRKLGSGLKALGAHVSVKQPTRRQLDSPATPKQELPNVCSWRWVNQAILDVLEHGEAAEDAESWLFSKDFELSHCGLTRALKIWR